MKLYADIAFRQRIPPANNGLFTFTVPENLHETIENGSVVKASLRGEINRAVVARLHHKKPLFETEDIVEVCTPELIEEKEIQLAKKIAKKTLVPLARVIPLFFPKKIFDGTGKMPQKQILSLKKDFSEHLYGKKLGTKMQTVVEILQEKNAEERLRLQKNANCTKATIDKMLEKEILQEEWKNAFEAEEIHPKEIPLDDEQKTVFDALLQEKKSLLFAPTGSGKSHVIRALAAEKIKNGKSVLLIVPEIGLTQNLLKKCIEVFGETAVAIFHSRLSNGEKAETFWRIKSGQAKIIVGSRASLFLPFQNLGLIAVEEEHEWTLKSDQSPRYHARDVAEYLSEMHNCPLIFSSATPSLEVLARTKKIEKNLPHEKGGRGVLQKEEMKPKDIGKFGTEKTNHISYNPELTEKARENRKNPTQPEKKIWEILARKEFSGYKFTKQKPIGNYIVDFYCAKIGLVIEIDGDTHYEKDAIVYDKKRTEFLESFGLHVVRYTNIEVMQSLEGPYDDLEKKIEKRTIELQKKNNPPTPLLRGEKTSQTADSHISLFSLPSRFPAQKITVVDMNAETQAKNFSPLSNILQQKIRETTAENAQVLLLLNRRGMFRVLICKECGDITRCPHCSVALVTHSKGGKHFLLCHSCGKVFGEPTGCSGCGSTQLEHRGSGTANIERIAKQLFPNEKVVRIDRDTTTGKNDFDDLCEAFAQEKTGILVGTQIVAKGIDFSRIGLVGILDADSGLHIPDFRAAEKTYALLTQACGRAGRRGQKSEVIVQTRMPHLPLFSYLEKQKTEEFLEQEMQQREQFFLPPFSQMIKLIFRAPKKEAAFANARKVQKLLQATAKRVTPDEKIQVAVAPALTPYKHGKFFVNVLITAKNPHAILEKTPLSGCVVDVDPLDTVG